MSIIWQCECGKRGKVSDDKGGKKGKCPACGSVIHIPLAPPPPPPPPESESDIFELAEEAPVKKPARAVPTIAPGAIAASQPNQPAAAVRSPTTLSAALKPPRQRGLREYAYLVTALALIPLGISLFSGDANDASQRLKRMMEKNPEIASKVEQLGESEDVSDDEFFDILPGKRIEGSLLPHDTWMHWGFAFLSAAVFMGLMFFMFPPGHAARTHLLWTGVFTATAGILVLIGFQFMAEWTQNWWVRGRSILVLVFYIVKFIGFSYRCADDPSNGFLLSFMGFTFGVGLCEEIVKALPLMWHFKNNGTLGWRAACLWGFASGVGFGVAEGIMYSSRYYNGIGGADIYVVRFVSCVALHAVWSAAVGIFLWKHQNLLNDAEGFFGFLVNAMVIVSVPMLLHGAYDTLLKKDMNSWALLVAGVSFAWLVFQIETARRADPDDQAGEEEDEGRVVYVAPVA